MEKTIEQLKQEIEKLKDKHTKELEKKELTKELRLLKFKGTKAGKILNVVGKAGVKFAKATEKIAEGTIREEQTEGKKKGHKKKKSKIFGGLSTDVIDPNSLPR